MRVLFFRKQTVSPAHKRHATLNKKKKQKQNKTENNEKESNKKKTRAAWKEFMLCCSKGSKVLWFCQTTGNPTRAIRKYSCCKDNLLLLYCSGVYGPVYPSKSGLYMSNSKEIFTVDDQTRAPCISEQTWFFFSVPPFRVCLADGRASVGRGPPCSWEPSYRSISLLLKALKGKP